MKVIQLSELEATEMLLFANEALSQWEKNEKETLTIEIK